MDADAADASALPLTAKRIRHQRLLPDTTFRGPHGELLLDYHPSIHPFIPYRSEGGKSHPVASMVAIRTAQVADV